MNVNPKTAFILEKQLREVMGSLQHARRLEGKVEMDASYHGGYVRPTNFKKHRRDRRTLANQSGRRQAVTVIRERNGRMRAFVFTEKEAAQRALDIIEPGSILYADEAKAYDGLEALFVIHRINHNGNDVKNYSEADRRLTAEAAQRLLGQ